MFRPSQRGMIPLSVLRTSFPLKGQEAAAVWTFSLGLSALAFPAPSRGRMPARQEGVFTKRLSDKQYIMKAESLLEHKCFFWFLFLSDSNIFFLRRYSIATPSLLHRKSIVSMEYRWTIDGLSYEEQGTFIGLSTKGKCLRIPTILLKFEKNVEFLNLFS